MRTLLRTVKGLFRSNGNPHVYVENRPPLFQKSSPWWTKWGYALIGCDLFMTGSAMEITWTNWSTLVKDEPASDNKDEKPTQHWEQRPVWQRAALCSAFFVGGVAAASAILIARARYLRTLDVFPPLEFATGSTKSKIAPTVQPRHRRRVFLQSTSHTRGHGVSFPLSKCKLNEGRDETELFLHVDGERGHWHIGLDGALVNGRKISPLEARDALLRQWDGGILSEELAHPFVIDGRWKKGPVRSS
ncbi:hypothetical protein PM082_001102 [Marasmius tenuissimus]|nr:hypothetical protein PM082_001102 [Marasmius tenuissimus]